MHQVRVDKIVFSDTAKSLVADIRVNLATGERGSVRVKVGSLLLLAQKAHEVLAIVPRDEKTGVIGWVEFAAEPLDADAIKAKGWADRVVRPVTP